MFRVSTGATWGPRAAVVALASAVALVTILGSDAEARGKRKFFKRTSHAAAATYSPRYADIVVDANTGDVLHSTNPDAQRHPASLTKIMTLYLLFERLEAGRVKLDSQMEVSAHAASQAPTKLGVRPGQTLMVEDAIKALVTKSANDAAVVVAEHLAGSEEEFGKLMTRKARALRMTRTVYRNASGLPDIEQVTTARDQALLGLAIQERFPRYYRYFSTASFSYRGVRMANHNRLLGRVEGVNGIKTGYTRMSGFNLVSSVQRGERRIVAVVLGGASGGARDAKMRSLIEAKVRFASVKRTAPKITEVAVADTGSGSPFPAPIGTPPEKAAPQVAQAAQPAPKARAAEAQAEQPALGSTDPIRPLLVRTFSVKAPAVKTASAGAFAPGPVVSDRQAVVMTAPLEAPKAEARAEALPPPPAGARPGVLGVLSSRDNAGEAPNQMVDELPARSVTASIAPAPQAAAKPQAAAREAAITDSKPRLSGWIVQVGAFEDVSEAKQKLAAARAKAGILKNAEAYTEVFAKGDKRYYRARFAGLPESKAGQACKELQRSKMACFVVRN